MPSLSNYTPCPKKRTSAQKVKDRRFAYPGTSAPDSLKTLYIIAWKYITRDFDFYRVGFDSYDFHHIPTLEATLVRFTTLMRGLAPTPRQTNLHSSARTPKASLGRNPKIKTPIELSTPIYIRGR